MSIETIGEALRAGWRIRVRCPWGKHDGMNSKRECVYSEELELGTLVWTRGADFPISRLEARLKCTKCSSRRVALLLDLPREPAGMAVARR